MITTNVIAAIAPSFLGLIQKIREEFAVYREFQDGDDDVLAAGLTPLDQADAEVIALEKEEGLILANEDLSDEGRRKAMAKAVGRAYVELAFVSKAAKQKIDAANEAKQTLEAIPKSPDDPTLDYLRSFEIRQELRKLPQAERMQLFLKATKDKNTALLRAFASDPFGSVLIEPEFARRVTEEQLQQTDGAEWRRLQTLRFVSERLTLLANALEYRLGNYGTTPTFPTPPITKSDLKMKNQTAPPDKSNAADRVPAGRSSFQ